MQADQSPLTERACCLARCVQIALRRHVLAVPTDEDGVLVAEVSFRDLATVALNIRGGFTIGFKDAPRDIILAALRLDRDSWWPIVLDFLEQAFPGRIAPCIDDHYAPAYLPPLR